MPNTLVDNETISEKADISVPALMKLSVREAGINHALTTVSIIKVFCLLGGSNLFLGAKNNSPRKDLEVAVLRMSSGELGCWGLMEIRKI